MDRLLRHTQGTQTLYTRNSNGDLADLSSTPTARILDSAGTQLATPTVTRTAVGTYEITITTAISATLDRYTVEWTEATGAQQRFETFFEVVGGFYFTLADARNFGDGELASTSEYPSADIRDAREQAEQDLEDECGVAFVRRGQRETLDGDGTYSLLLEHFRIRKLVSVKIDGTALTSSELADVHARGRELIRDGATWPSGLANIEVLYEHGHDRPPLRIREASLILVRTRLVPSNIDERALSHTDELGTRQYAVPGQRHPFGIPKVDAAVYSYREKGPAVR